MAKLKLVKHRDAYAGRCYYRDFGVFTKTENPYAMDKWFFNVPPLGFICTASKEILNLDGHLPPHTWAATSLPALPEVVQGWSFAFDEVFDEAGRVASESLAYKVLCDPSQHIVQIVFGPGSEWTEVFVSPHHGLLVGADPDRGMVLSSVFLLDVDGFPDLARRSYP